MPSLNSANSTTELSISVIMVDGSFRENAYSAESLSKQNYPSQLYEIIWVEFYSQAHPTPSNLSKVKVMCLNHSEAKVYHSSICFNAGIRAAKGEIVVFTDADQIYSPDFLGRIQHGHAKTQNLVSYVYRYDEPNECALSSHALDELERVCIYKNPLNYGACMSVRKRWLYEINGFEEHPIFATGFHANGLDVYTRFRNYGMSIQWHPTLKVFHPWHKNTLTYAPQYDLQREWINWRSRKRQYLAMKGLDRQKDAEATLDVNSRALLQRLTDRLDKALKGRKRLFQPRSLWRRASQKLVSVISRSR